MAAGRPARAPAGVVGDEHTGASTGEGDRRMLTQRKQLQGPAVCVPTLVRVAVVALAGLAVSGVGSSALLVFVARG